MTYSYGFYFAQPWWLVACLLLVPIIWLGRRYLAALGPVRRVLAIVLRCLVTLILIALLARPILSRRSERVTLIPVIDRSQSIPVTHQEASLDYLEKALASKVPRDQLAVVDVAEAPSISKLPSGDITVRRRNTTLTGGQTNLADGVQMAMAIAPPDTAVRILLVSEGNETSGDLKEAARTAAANKIPIDVLRVRYQSPRRRQEVARPFRCGSFSTARLPPAASCCSTSTANRSISSRTLRKSRCPSIWTPVPTSRLFPCPSAREAYMSTKWSTSPMIRARTRSFRTIAPAP
ncbi:MAG: vWA domain-containing protein [Planctomycetota bacterium]